MIGVPGSGKSTWINNQDWADNCVVVSTDYYIDKLARRKKLSYKQSFDIFMTNAVRLMTKKVIRARNEGKDIIWDQTSTTVASRRRKIKMLPGYKIVAVVMKPLPKLALIERIQLREGKEIPISVVDDMIEFYEQPSKVEGIDEIWFAE
jgi:predicted kinase